MDFKQVIIWGHTSRGHTHYWIHHAFNRAFKYLKYNTFWVDNKLSSLESIDRTIPSLFLTEGQVDKYIPLDNKNYYIIHNCKVEKYKNLNNVLSLQVYTSPVPSKPNISKYDKYMYYDLDRKKCWIPWATDLLPNEIQNIINTVQMENKQNNALFVGSVWGGKYGNISEIYKYKKACLDKNISFQSCKGVSMLQNIQIIQQSKYAPTIVGEWQKNCGYIPCRAFKNISYGGYCITNSLEVYNLFDKRICYEKDCYKLLDKSIEYIQNMDKKNYYFLINYVKDKHTYVNRINFLLAIFKKLKSINKHSI